MYIYAIEFKCSRHFIVLTAMAHHHNVECTIARLGSLIVEFTDEDAFYMFRMEAEVYIAQQDWFDAQSEESLAALRMVV